MFFYIAAPQMHSQPQDHLSIFTVLLDHLLFSSHPPHQSSIFNPFLPTPVLKCKYVLICVCLKWQQVTRDFIGCNMLRMRKTCLMTAGIKKLGKNIIRRWVVLVNFFYSLWGFTENVENKVFAIWTSNFWNNTKQYWVVRFMSYNANADIFGAKGWMLYPLQFLGSVWSWWMSSWAREC